MYPFTSLVTLTTFPPAAWSNGLIAMSDIFWSVEMTIKYFGYLSGPEWLVRRAGGRAEIGVSVLFYFIYILYTATYTNGKLNRHR